jgi:hypothetical protein
MTDDEDYLFQMCLRVLFNSHLFRSRAAMLIR